MSTARSTPNIALIKYWGNRNNDWRLPAADSLSFTLSEPCVDVIATVADSFAVTSTKELSEKDVERFKRHLELMHEYLNTLNLKLPEHLAFHVDSHIPPGIGLASSAAVFSATAIAVAGLLEQELTTEQLSVLARLGSGSAARSVLGGFVTLENTGTDGIDSAVARQVAPVDHWELWDIVIAPSTTHKKVGSTEGHAGAATSPHFVQRLQDIRLRQSNGIEAVLMRDFEKLQTVAEADSLDMHHCMATQQPPLHYLSNETYRIIRELEALRRGQHLPVLYTMDAGPTVHCICEAEAKKTVETFASQQSDCTIFIAKIGSGAERIKG